MNLIEMLIYIVIVTLILFGSVFPVYSMIFGEMKSNDQVEILFNSL
jgi:hypothetical protein